MATKKLVKPTPHTNPYWDWSEVQHYIEKKYKIDTRDYGQSYKKGKVDKKSPELDFWHWLLDRCGGGISNGCFTSFPIKEWLDEKDDGDDLDEYTTPDWVKEILQLIYYEFQEDEMQVHIWW